MREIVLIIILSFRIYGKLSFRVGWWNLVVFWVIAVRGSFYSRELVCSFCKGRNGGDKGFEKEDVCIGVYEEGLVFNFVR